jgi:2-polyprenyl-3-methyl-5-hydroxy-6-metoxy-1,4-benzoquinol methylase
MDCSERPYTARLPTRREPVVDPVIRNNWRSLGSAAFADRRGAHNLSHGPSVVMAKPPGLILASQVGRAYDEIAPKYNSQLEQNPVADYMRARLHAYFLRVFHPQDRVLDLAAGTGIDACFLASREVQVTAVDASTVMIEELERAAHGRGLSIKTHVTDVENLSALEFSEFDGVVSSFGGLNTVADMRQLAQALAECLKPRGLIVLHALNDFCFWQTVRAATRGHLRFARESEFQLGSSLISHRFYNPFTLWRESFASRFSLNHVYGLSVVAAPPLVRRFPRFAPALYLLDAFAGRLFPSAGDFFMMELGKRDE